MPQSAKALHHFHKNKHYLYENTIEKLAYAVAFLTPIVTLPQIFQIWLTKDASGVSLLTWISYLFIATVMTLYGILYKEKPLIMMYTSMLFINAAIITGVVLYS